MKEAVMPCCLRTLEGNPVPLLGVALSGEVFGAHGRLVLRQRYKNAEDKPIEAIYTFPIPSDAALVGFAMECAGRRMVAEVKEREEAFAKYDDAISKGHGAALLDQERRNIFTASVGNLLPGEETVVEVVYVQELSADEGALRLMVPTLVAPRYIPGTVAGDRTGHGAADPTDRVPDADRISPTIGAVKYGLAVDVVFDLGRDVTVESPSHAIVVSDEADHKKRVTFAKNEVPLDRDLVLVASGAAGPAAGVVAAKAKGSDGTFALTVVPDLFADKGTATPHDVVFVIDTSGSMGGASIEQARTAARLCLRHLVEGDRFQMIAFQSSFATFKPGLVPFTQRMLEEADRWLASLDAAGGTEMLQPLLAALAPAPDKIARDRVVVLLTDGEVGNEAEIGAQAVAKAKELGSARIYTFGIGTNVSDLLLRDLAQRTHGAMELIYPGERIDDKVTAQFARAVASRVEDISVSFTGVDAGELAPSELADLVDGEPWVLYGRYSEPGMGRAQIRGKLRGERFLLEVPIDLPAEAEREGLAALWATARIRDLETAETALTGRRSEANKKRIVALSVEHQVASKYASFVVVEKREGDRRAQGVPEARPVPVNAPAGWSMFDAADADVKTRQTLAQGYGRASGYAQSAGPRGYGAPPPMAQPAPMYSPARAAMPAPRPAAGMPPPPAQAAPPPPPAAGGFLGQVRQKVADLFSTAAPSAKAESSGVYAPEYDDFSIDGELSASIAPEPATLVPPAEAKLAQSGDDAMRALFERQLASGLWEGDANNDAARLLATARALAACHAASIDSAHALYGAQVKKAVAAVIALAPVIAAKADGEHAAIAALTAAYLVASSPRLRRQVLDLIQGSASAGIGSLGAVLTTNDAARQKLRELGVS